MKGTWKPGTQEPSHINDRFKNLCDVHDVKQYEPDVSRMQKEVSSNTPRKTLKYISRPRPNHTSGESNIANVQDNISCLLDYCCRRSDIKVGCKKNNPHVSSEGPQRNNGKCLISVPAEQSCGNYSLRNSNVAIDATCNIQLNKSCQVAKPQKPPLINLFSNNSNKIVDKATMQIKRVHRTYGSVDRSMNKLDIMQQDNQLATAMDDNMNGTRALTPCFYQSGQLVEDFPELSARRIRKPNRKQEKPVNGEDTAAALDRCSTKKSLNETNFKQDNPKIKLNPCEVKSWKPKTKDPISFNLSQALQPKPEKCKTVIKKEDPTSNRVKAIGNILDSDQPRQRKGKVRPDKVHRPSTLKRRVLLDRTERRKQADENEDDNFMTEAGPLLFTESCSINERCSLKDTKYHLDNEASIVNRINLEDRCTNSGSVEQLDTAKNIHSRRFREYCTNCVTDDLVVNVCRLLEKMAYFQDRTFARDPIKAQARRRYVAGIHQTDKYLRIKKVKILIIAPDLERSSGEGGLDEKINNLKAEAEGQGVPCVFGPRRKPLGKAVCKKSLVSCVAVLSYEGAEELFSDVLISLEDAKSKYLKLTGQSPEPTEETRRSSPEVIDNKASEALITSPLLATLRENLPADKLMSALGQNRPSIKVEHEVAFYE